MLNNSDKYFQEQIDLQAKDYIHRNWDRNQAWDKLQYKKRGRLRKLYSYAASIVLFIGLIIGALNLDYISKEQSFIENTYDEYEKRQMLQEIEIKMSGQYIREEICFDCENTYDIIFKENRSVNPEYVDIFNQELN